MLDKKQIESGIDIVLLQLPFWGIGCPPLGLALLKSYLKQHNIQCKTIDINANAYCLGGKTYSEFWEIRNGHNFCEDQQVMFKYYIDNRALFLYYINEIQKINPKIVGCTCHNSSILITKLFLEDLKNHCPDMKLIVGGPETAYFMKNTEQLLSKDYIDAVCLDEGEVGLVKYCQTVKHNSNSCLPGIAYKVDGKVVSAADVEWIKRLDDLPFPDFSDFNLNYYSHNDTLPSYTSRGCINKCIYCSARNYMKQFRFRSAERIYAEIVHLKKWHKQLRYVRMCDNISNGNIKELERFCDLMIGANLGVGWNLENAVLRKEMTKPLYKKLKRAGCDLIGYGLETPSPKLLEKCGKTLSKDINIPKVLKDGKKSGICISINIMFGLPGETEGDFKNLMVFLRKNRRHFDMINPSLNFCEFYPGSDVSIAPEKYGIDLSKGHLFWETLDGENTYPIRMMRFEEFCKQAKKFKLDNLFNVIELPNKHKSLFKYYFKSDQYDDALKVYGKIDLASISDELKEMHKSIITGTPQKGECHPNYTIEKHPSFIGIKDSLVRTSLKDMLSSLENEEILENSFQKSWKFKVRKLLFKAIGFNIIDKKLNAAYMMMKILDEKIQSVTSDYTI